jgi:hypothetical protein
LLIPTFFVSIGLERLWYRSSWADLDRRAVDRTVWFANLWSYAFLFAAVSGVLAWQLYKGPEKAPAVKRSQEHPVDLAYLHNVAIPSADPAVRPKLLSSVTQLESILGRFGCVHA